MKTRHSNNTYTASAETMRGSALPMSLTWALLAVLLSAGMLVGCGSATSDEADVDSADASAETSTSTNTAAAAPAPAEPTCTTCGEVVAITPRTIKGEGSGKGAVAGAIIGGVVGHQFGSGSGNDAATAGGAIAGAAAGHEAEKRYNGATVFDVTVAMDAGGQQTVTIDSAAGLNVGDEVQVRGNNIIRS